MTYGEGEGKDIACLGPRLGIAVVIVPWESNHNLGEPRAKDPHGWACRWIILLPGRAGGSQDPAEYLSHLSYVTLTLLAYGPGEEARVSAPGKSLGGGAIRALSLRGKAGQLIVEGVTPILE